MQNVFEIKAPAGADGLPLIFDSPHSGRSYPADFAYACALEDLKRAEDNHVDELFDGVPGHGGTLLCALFPRTYIDVNRAENDIDAELLSGPWPEALNPAKGRSSAGIGLVRRLVRPGMPVYNRSLSPQEVRHRLDNYYKPYHGALKNLLERAHYNFGQVWHINCHSMPATAVARLSSSFRVMPPDFVLGDRDGTSCDPDFRQAMLEFLKGAGYRVAVNDPYKGVEILRRYGRPGQGFHSLQLEIGKSLYWDEKEGRKSKNFNTLKEDIKKLVAVCADYVRHQTDTALAAD